MAILAPLSVLHMTVLLPDRQPQLLVIVGSEAVFGLGVAVLVLGRWRLPPLQLAFALACSVVVTVLVLLVFVPESRTMWLMTLAMLPPVAALLLPWGTAVEAAWLIAGAAGLAVFSVSSAGAGAPVPTAEWVGAWVVLIFSGFTSLIGSLGAAKARRKPFVREMQARRAHLRTLAREAELERLSGEPAQATHIDSLTGLGNRLRLNDELEVAVARAMRYGSDCALALLDLDHFKDCNDSCGHIAGDAALRAVAGVLAASVRAADTVCRFGGEEFVVIMPEQTLEGGGSPSGSGVRSRTSDCSIRRRAAVAS